MDIVRMLRGGWWVIALTTLMALSVALLATYLAVPKYKATVQLILSPDQELSGPNAVYGATALEKRTLVSTFAELLDSDRVYNETAATLQLPVGVLEEYERSSVILPETSILEHSVTGPDPQQAALIANSVSQRAIEYAKGLYSAYDVHFLNLATAPTEPVSPRPVQDVSLAVGLGLLLGMGLAVLRGVLLTDKPFGFPWEVASATTAAPLSSGDVLQQLQQELSRQRDPLSLAMLQLDVIERHSPSMSVESRRQLQQQAVSLLRKELRGKDVVLPWGSLAIVLLLPEVTGNKARRALGHLSQVLADALVVSAEGEPLQVEPHVGVTERHDGQGAQTLLSQAEAAMLEARQYGRTAELYALGDGPRWTG
jgi:capsular polysaccharide biosynthesis protein/GGDEF domain-containing protein